ncbi:MAG: hypothetical protein M0C28_38800 [Candidatus Moduliflexus flocculans]|nr:hypothetical protein [Candidatus Moduliflexus flocculans]
MPGAGFEGRESAGLLDDIVRRTLVTRFNDGDDLDADHRRSTATGSPASSSSPSSGVGGFLRGLPRVPGAGPRADRRGTASCSSSTRSSPASVSRLPGVQTLYGIRPDLSTFGKIIGGGHAVAAVIGPARIMEACERDLGGRRPGHVRGRDLLLPLRIHAGRACSCSATWPRERADGLSPNLARAGESAAAGHRGGLRRARAPGPLHGRRQRRRPPAARCSWSISREGPTTRACDRPEVLQDAGAWIIALREDLLKLALLVNGVNVVHGGGAVSAAHGPKEIGATIAAYGEAARLFAEYLD